MACFYSSQMSFTGALWHCRKFFTQSLSFWYVSMATVSEVIGKKLANKHETDLDTNNNECINKHQDDWQRACFERIIIWGSFASLYLDVLELHIHQSCVYDNACCRVILRHYAADDSNRQWDNHQRQITRTSEKSLSFLTRFEVSHVFGAHLLVT